MTIAHLEKELARMRALYAEDPQGFREECYRDIRDNAALIERFFNLGASVAMNANDYVLPNDDWNDQFPIALALQRLAEDIRLTAEWLDREHDEHGDCATPGGAQ